MDDEAWALNLRGREEGARPELDTLASLRAAEGGSSRSYVLLPPSACSPGSEGWMKDSDEPASSMCSCASPTRGGEGCCGSGSLVCPSQTTYETWALGSHAGSGGEATNSSHAKGGPVGMGISRESVPALRSGRTQVIASTSSQAGSRARTCPSPDDAPGSTDHGPACSSSSPASSTLFDPDGFSSRTYPGCSVATAVGTSESCLERWPTSGTAWHGGFSTHVSSECRSAAGVCSSLGPALTEIIEPPQSVPARYSLSARAARGILRRAEKRGRTLPSHLSAALEQVARTTTTGKADG